MATTILSIENSLSWSWGIVIRGILGELKHYDLIRIMRGFIPCERCGAGHCYNVDMDLQRHFDVLLCQNHDGIRYLDNSYRPKTCVRIGGICMNPNLDPTKYYDDFRNVGAVIATNQMLAELALPVNPHTTVIPNGVPLDLFCPAPEGTGYPNRPFTIGFAGNIWGMGAEYKGWRYYIQAGVDLAPEGVQQKYLLHKHSQINHDRMPEEFYHQIDALVLPSKGEGCSNVVTEALACGVPVIMTKVGFHGELLTDGEDVLYIERDLTGASPQTTEQIKQAVRRLMSEPDLRTRLASNGRAFAEQYHDVRKVAALYDAVFQDLLQRRLG